VELIREFTYYDDLGSLNSLRLVSQFNCVNVFSLCISFFRFIFAFVRIYSGKFSKLSLISASHPCFFSFPFTLLNTRLCPSFSLGNVASGMEAGTWQKIQVCRKKFWRRCGVPRTGGGKNIELPWCCFLRKLFCSFEFRFFPVFSYTGYFFSEACSI